MISLNLAEVNSPRRLSISLHSFSVNRRNLYIEIGQSLSKCYLNFT